MSKARITSRRIEILKLINEGYDNMQIVHKMNISISNVKLQISRTINHFGVRTRHEAVEAARKQGYIQN